MPEFLSRYINALASIREESRFSLRVSFPRRFGASPFLSVTVSVMISTGMNAMNTKQMKPETLRAANDNPGGATTAVLFDMVTLIAQAYVAKGQEEGKG